VRAWVTCGMGWLRLVGLFYRILSLLYGSFEKQTYNLLDPTNKSHPTLKVECTTLNVEWITLNLESRTWNFEWITLNLVKRTLNVECTTLNVEGIT